MTSFALGAHARAEGYRVIAFQSVGSTNSEAMDAARAGDPGRVWFVTDSQVSGRGRRGRPWQTPPGNLAASLLLKFARPDPEIAGLGFVAGVALGSALRDVLPEARIRLGLDGADARTPEGPARIALKWPNDVLADGAKLAGILLEAEILPAGEQALVIGFGVNVASAPQGTPYPATSLAALGAPLDAAALFAALTEAWCRLHARWQAGRGLVAILADWRQFAAGIGEPVAITTPSGVVRGVFETIDDRGRLCLRKPDGRMLAIAAGDVHFGATASVREQLE